MWICLVAAAYLIPGAFIAGIYWPDTIKQVRRHKNGFDSLRGYPETYRGAIAFSLFVAVTWGFVFFFIAPMLKMQGEKNVLKELFG